MRRPRVVDQINDPEIAQNEEFNQRFFMSPKEIKIQNEKLEFDSIVFKGRKIKKRAYIYELLTSQKPYTFYQIRKLAKCGMEKIYKVRDMINSNTDESVFYEGELKRGPPFKMTPQIKAEFILIASGSLSDKSLAEKINSRFQLEKGFARSTINFYRHKFGFLYKPPKQRQELTEKHKQKRKSFVYSIFNIPNFPWRTIIFSDESRICLKNDGKWVCRRRGDVNPEIFADKAKFENGIMVYGAIGFDYKSKLVFTSNRIDSETYARNIQQSEMFEDLEDREYLFMQDGAPCHTSKIMRDWLHSRCNLLIFWPPNSPDLNPIEMIWGIIKLKLNQLPLNLKPKDLNELKQSVQEIWDSIDFATINGLIESFYYRLILVATHDGESIQPYYRHGRDSSENYQQAGRTFLEEKDEEIQLLEIDDLILKQDINYPSPDGFCITNQNEAQINPTTRRKWSKEEDIILLNQLAIFGPKWPEIAQSLPGRTPNSIRKRAISKGYY